MGTGYFDQLKKYNEFFPNIKIPTSGKAARSNIKTVENVFRWFFENYSYSWDTIFEATGRYVEDFSKKKYHYMRTSMYFVRKQEQDKSFISDLADYCALVESGDEREASHFAEKVV
jgi:hypothetical protein